MTSGVCRDYTGATCKGEERVQAISKDLDNLTKGDIILADFKEYLMIDKGGIQSASSIHVRFVNDESCFRFVYRCDGQPKWNSSLTPFKGSNTQSPFVALNA